VEAKRYRLAVVAIRPQPYNSPLYRSLAAHPRIDLTVYYLLDEGLGKTRDLDYRRFEWGYPVLDGYRSRFLRNRAPRPSGARFTGAFHPELFCRLHLRHHDAAVVPGWFPSSVWLAHWACWRHGLPVLMRSDANAADPVRRPWVRTLVLPRLFRRCAAFLAVGSRNAAFYRGCGVPEEKLFLAPYAVDNDFFQQQRAALQPRRGELRRQLGLPDEALLLLYAGRLVPQKRPGDLLAAVARLDDARVWLALVGEGPERGRLEQQVAALGLRRVFFAGFRTQAELSEYYMAADIFVLPSEREPWGLVVNEAMNFGLPVVVSQVAGAVGDLVLPGTGRTFPPGDVDALAACLRPLLADAGLRARLGQGALDRIRQWSHAGSPETIVRALEFATGGRGRAGLR